jgi:Domain of Unknown Function (DUF1080)
MTRRKRSNAFARPHPPVVTPGAKACDPPSDAIVLFDGKDLSRWLPATQTMHRRHHLTWRSRLEGRERLHGNRSRQRRPGDEGKFGDVQVHAEFALPTTTDSRVNRGNSGIFLQGRYEVQIFDEFANPIYPDGQIGASTASGRRWPMPAASQESGRFTTSYSRRRAWMATKF